MTTRLAESTAEREQTPLPSERVTNLLEAGWTSACGGSVAISGWQIQRRPSEGFSRFLDVAAGDRHVQIYVSPTGRSVRVYVDGTEI